jgi:hypothetical protein
MMPYKLLNAGGYVNSNGECIKMNLSDKVIYAHLKNRFDFFKSLGNEYYDTQQSIADMCNMDLKATGNILRKFIEDGLTTVYKKRFNGYPKNVYTYVPNLQLWYKDKKKGSQKAVVVVETLDFEYDFPEDLVDSMSDVGYYPESEFDINNLDLEY